MSCDMKSSVISYAVLNDGANLSDHLPVEFKLCFSLSRIPSKADRRTVLEYQFLSSHSLQFRFKRGSGCSSAFFVVQQVVQYYTQRGSNVYVCALDATKAFDYVDHTILIDKLIRRGVSPCFLGVISNWYSKLSAVVRWNHVFSDTFHVLGGVIQGGVLSPVLLNLYVDELISIRMN